MTRVNNIFSLIFHYSSNFLTWLQLNAKACLNYFSISGLTLGLLFAKQVLIAILESRASVIGKGNNKDLKVVIHETQMWFSFEKGKFFDFEKEERIRGMTAVPYFLLFIHSFIHFGSAQVQG